MAFARRKGNEAKKRRKKIPFEKRLRQSARRVLRFLHAERERAKWRRRNERGAQRESHVCTLLKILHNEGAVPAMACAERHSWMDFVLKGDSAAQRRDGVWVPVQAKPSKKEKDDFLLLKGDLCTRMYGAPPIVIVVPFEGFFNPRARAYALLRKINAWRGTGFDYREWMTQADEAFRPWSSSSGSGKPGRAGRCIRVFVRRHPEYFKESGLLCGLLGNEQKAEAK